MLVTPRQARLRLARAIDAAGSQRAWSRQHGLTASCWQTAVSKAVTGRGPLRPEILAALGLRVNPNTDEIEEAAARSTFWFVAVQASGKAGVAAALALLNAAFPTD